MDNLIIEELSIFKEAPNNLPRFPDRFENGGAMDAHRELPSNDVTEREAFPCFSLPRDILFKIIANEDFPGFISIKCMEDPFGREGDTLETEVFQPQASKRFASRAPFLVDNLFFPPTFTIGPEELPDSLLDFVDLVVREHLGRRVINAIGR